MKKTPLVVIIVLITSFVSLTTFAYMANKGTPSNSLDEELTIMKRVVEEGSEFQYSVSDPKLHKWILRTIFDNINFELSLSEGEIIRTAEEEMLKNEQFIKHAEIMYDVTLNKEEVDQFMNQTREFLYGDELKKVEEMAKLLKISTEEFILEFERDRNTQSLIWMNLQPILQEKYSTYIENIVNNDEINSILLEKYYEEMGK